MGTCTSTARHRQKKLHQYNRIPLKNSIVLDIKPPPPLPPLPTFPNYRFPLPHTLLTDFDILSTSLTKPVFHQTDTNSLIHLYSSNTNNNNNNSNISNWMSLSSAVTHVPPHIPVPKTRLPVYHPPQQPSAPVRPKSVPSTVISNNHTDSTRPMSTTNRPPPPTAMQTRFGFIPRPTASGIQQVRAPTFASRSRSISPTSTVSANSSSASSLVSQRLSKGQTTSKTTPNRSIPPSSTTNNTSNPRTLASPRHRDPSATRPNVKSTLHAPTAASLIRSRTPSRTSATSPTTSPPVPPPSSAPLTSSQTTTTMKTDVNAIRDRYKTQKRMNFFTRRTPISAANGSPVASSIKSPESIVVYNEKKSLSTPNTQNNESNSKTPPQISSSHLDSVYTNESSPFNHSPSSHLSQSSKHRQRAIRLLSSASAISDVLNQNTLLEDDICSLKSDDLICDFEDTLTIDSASKNDATDSCSSVSIPTETIKTHSTAKSNTSLSQPAPKEHRSATIARCSTATNGNLRESIDELNRLSNRMDNGIDSEHNRRLMSRSVSLKPPASYLPPLEDAEQMTMDIESYRQVMKDVMVVKTVLHQLDRLLKHSDGANLTDSMIGSFHECHDSVFTARRYSLSNTDGNLRNSIDENSSYEDLLKEIIVLRKEKEQDKQTIKLLQEQMYKYSSQTSG